MAQHGGDGDRAETAEAQQADPDGGAPTAIGPVAMAGDTMNASDWPKPAIELARPSR
jgi:hypothetical protein